ncbi:hypothetical protein [Sphingobium subterraneum]|uniref:Uncharacterized protein n=1 Tax=Sphingobium subterraneum TaxID=627688 RepID=A0A841IZW8_9SPHN|nr:hypothetical protein [Sphingobium subterraneum]MBB6123880.1 hypothetical protein [Sphingobium subterraneum]
MTDPDFPPAPEPTAAQREAAAKQRFIALNLFRLSGVAIVMFGFLIMMERFGFVAGQKAKIMGAIIATVGLFQTIVVPRILVRAWRTPREE